MKFAFSLLLLTTALVALGLISESANTNINTIGSAEAQTTSGRGPVRMIRFVVLHDGIYPRQLRVDQGLLNIALEDKTNESNGLLIESVIGDQRTRVTQVTRAEKHWRGRTLVRLTPGRYVVSDASNPNHQAELVVTHK